MIEIKNINVSYNQQIVFKDSQIIIPDGQLTAINGKSGSGKTTLFYIIGLISCAKGYEYSYNGRNIDITDDHLKSTLRKSKIGFVFQDKNLHEYLTIEENLKLYCLIAGLEYTQEKANTLLEKVHLTIDPQTKTEVLSGGEKQRLAIACALIKEPDIIIADEPTSALDDTNTKIIIELLKGIAHDGKMVIIATHNQNILKDCDIVYHLKNNQILLDETINKDIVVSDIKETKISSKFYKWYTHFQFGKGKLEKFIFAVIPIFSIFLCIFLYAMKDSLASQYKQSLNQFANNEVLVENKTNLISDKGIDLLSRIQGVRNIYPVYKNTTNELLINEKKISLNKPIQVVSYYDYQTEKIHTNWQNKTGDIYLSFRLSEELKINKDSNIQLDNLNLTKNKFKIKGVLYEDYFLTQSQQSYIIYVPYQYFHESETNAVLLQLNDFESFLGITDKINEINPLYSTIISQDKYLAQISNLEIYTSNLSTFVTIVCSLVIFILVISQFFTINNQKYELTVLKANGLSNKEIFKMMLILFLQTIVKTTISVICLLLTSKLIVYILGINLKIFTITTLYLSIIFILGIYLAPTILSTLLICHYDVEKLLRF